MDSSAALSFFAEDSSFENNTITHVGGYGIESFSKNLEIVSNEITDAGAGGIKVGGGYEMKGENILWDRGIDYGDIEGHIITDNRIHDNNQVYKEAIGIWILIGHDNTIAHNHIYNTPYSGISVGWRWSAGETSAGNNKIEFNHVHDVMQELVDGAAIYTLGEQSGSTIRNNIIHETYPTPKPKGAGGYAFYLDQGSKGITVTDNTVYRATDGVLLHRSFDNVVENNTFVDTWHYCFNFAGKDEQDQDLGRIASGNTLSKNICYYTTDTTVMTAHTPATGVKSSDYNLFFTPLGTKPEYSHGIDYLTDRVKYYRDSRTGDPEWVIDPSINEITNTETNSVHYETKSIIDDPLFVGYANDDFSLDQNSPAIQQLGFQPIDTSTVGPRNIECFNNDMCSFGQECVQRKCEDKTSEDKTSEDETTDDKTRDEDVKPPALQAREVYFNSIIANGYELSASEIEVISETTSVTCRDAPPENGGIICLFGKTGFIKFTLSTQTKRSIIPEYLQLFDPLSTAMLIHEEGIIFSNPIELPFSKDRENLDPDYQKYRAINGIEEKALKNFIEFLYFKNL